MNGLLSPPWRLPGGRFSGLALGTWLVCVAPGLWLAYEALADRLGARPLTSAIHESGLWAIRLLWLCLLVTPLSRIADRPRLLLVRRMLGLWAMSYALLHLLLYVADQGFVLPTVLAEIVSRSYLTIGAVALTILTVLGVTSHAALIRRLGGRRWRRLHRLIYPAACLAFVHFLLQTRLDPSEAWVMAGCLLLLFAARSAWMRRPDRLALAAVAAALATAGIEAAWFGLTTGIGAWPILRANTDGGAFPRPAAVVLLIGLVPAALRLLSARRPALPATSSRRDP